MTKGRRAWQEACQTLCHQFSGIQVRRNTAFINAVSLAGYCTGVRSAACRQNARSLRGNAAPPVGAAPAPASAIPAAMQPVPPYQRACRRTVPAHGCVAALQNAAGLTFLAYAAVFIKIT
jgi:hypothetical protein